MQFSFFLLSSVALVLATSSSANSGNGNNNNTRITMGSDVAQGEIPWQVSIQYLGHTCSGVIIGPRWVLTAASCVVGLSETLTSIRHGSIYHNTGGVLTGITKFIIHPNFDRKTLLNDIALVYTAEKLSTNSYASLAGDQDFIFPGTTLTISGWGFQMATTGTLSHILRKADLPYIYTSDCVRAYSSENIPIDGEDRMLCAGNLENGGPGICEGDQGGPIFLKSTGTLFGLASFSDECGQPQKPSVFTSVAKYRDWINLVINVSLQRC